MAKNMAEFHRGEARRAEAYAARQLRSLTHRSCGAALAELVDAAQAVGAVRAHLGSVGEDLTWQEKEAANRLADALYERREAVEKTCVLAGGIFTREG